jgi:hypothetical protein
MEVQERIGKCSSWGVILPSWIGLFLVLALMFRVAELYARLPRRDTITATAPCTCGV